MASSVGSRDRGGACMRVLRARSLGISLESVCPLFSPEPLSKVGIGNTSVWILAYNSLQAAMPALPYLSFSIRFSALTLVCAGVWDIARG